MNGLVESAVYGGTSEKMDGSGGATCVRVCMATIYANTLLQRHLCPPTYLLVFNWRGVLRAAVIGCEGIRWRFLFQARPFRGRHVGDHIVHTQRVGTRARWDVTLGRFSQSHGACLTVGATGIANLRKKQNNVCVYVCMCVCVCVCVCVLQKEQIAISCLLLLLLLLLL